MVWILVLFSGIPGFSKFDVHGAVVFGNLSYDEKLVKQWDTLAAAVDMERTDLQNHYTSTYPNPKVIASVKQQTGFSPGGKWGHLEYRNVYCVSHSGEAANNPVSSMVCSSAWYAKKPWTLQNLPDYMKAWAGGDAYRLRFNFLMLAYAADYHADQNGVNSDSIVGTADYYLCQGICTLTEEAQFTGNYAHDWGIYEPVVMDWASRFHPNGLGSSRVCEEMKANAQSVFDIVWHTAKLMAECTESSEKGFTFYPAIQHEADGMYYARFPVTEETRTILLVSEIDVQGDWKYRFAKDSLEFYSATGEMPTNGCLASINLQNANGIICSSIGEESVQELHQPVQVRGRWSLTYSQANLVSALSPGTRIFIGNGQAGESSSEPDFPSSGGVARYKHTEKWQADYAVNLRKFDAETGHSLEGAQFDILEAFDDSQLAGSILEDDNWDNAAGSQFLRWDGWDSPYEETGVDPCSKDQEITDEDGWLTEMESSGAGPLYSNGTRAHRDVKFYSYTKGYCSGHPEPDPEDEEEMDEYEREISVCERLQEQGGFFHTLGGGAELLREDRDRHYEAFVSLTYDYSARELTARDGYILHNQDKIHEPHEERFDGIHKDTIPIETVTVHSSQYYELQSGRSQEIEPEEVPLTNWTFDPQIRDEDAWMEDADDNTATVSNASISNAAESNAAASNASKSRNLQGKILPILRRCQATGMAEASASGWRKMRNSERVSVQNFSAARVSGIAPLPVGNADYGGRCADWTFEVYDYRTEGEVHVNKRDLDLQKGEQEVYDAYGDTQGDAALNGAVYGLFAAEDIIHPDGKTGVVYQKGNLTSVAVTNENGDFSFWNYTEKPGSVYDYDQEKIISTGYAGPDNLYGKSGDCWVGRPLILGSYFVQELVRSEGYELSVYGINEDITNRLAWLNGGDAEAKGIAELTQMEEAVLTDPDTGLSYLTTQLTFQSEDVMNGYDIRIKGIDPASGPSFYTTVKGLKEVYSEWQEPVISSEPVEAKAGSKVLISGTGIQAEAGDLLELPNGEIVAAEETVLEPVNSPRVILSGENGSIPTFDIRYLPELNGISGENEDEFLDCCNQAFAAIGLAETGNDAPYQRISLSADRTKWAEDLYTYLEADTCPAFNAARLEAIVSQDGSSYAVLRYSFVKEDVVQPVVYSASDDAFYVKYDVKYAGNTDGYLYRKIPFSELSEADYELGNRLFRWIKIDREKPEKEEIDLYEDLEYLDFITAQEFCSYWAYGMGDYLRNADGSIYEKTITTYEWNSGYHREETFYDTPLTFVYDPDEQAYICHISPEQIPADGTQMISIRYEDIFAGNRSGLAVSAVPSMDVSGTYIQPLVLAYPGQEQIYEDCGTRTTPIMVLERIISEKVKVTKTVENEAGERQAADGFRFKIYLKSNLERLYCNESGKIVWMNRDEEELDGNEIQRAKNTYPAKVMKLFTKNTAGQSDVISYKPILERDESGCCYEKFFHAVKVANHDKWDDGKPDFSSWRPIGNQPNRTEYTLENVKISDAVRQFAIDWYLDEAVEKQLSKSEQEAAYSDEFYDEALYAAVVRAQDYLTPFFAYDLDEIYAISWDSETGGGSDGDLTTLSADMRGEAYCYGISEYLPYGTYVIVEQQPGYAYLGDMENKHYQADIPKEVSLPLVYADYESAQAEPEILNDYYEHEGVFSSRKVPWSVVDPGGLQEEKTGSVNQPNGESSYRGYGYRKFFNPEYSLKFRIEKLDAVTHENLLHDEAIFRIYKAQRNEDSYGEGEVLFYQEPTMIYGSQAFLKSMKAEHIQPMRRGPTAELLNTDAPAGPGVLYTGIVGAGTPVCYEEDWVLTCSAMRRGEDSEEPSFQNVGYSETSESLKAGVYVICEETPPYGYVRTDPIAVEVYSDKITYYKEGNRDERVLGAVYEYNYNENPVKTVRIYVENEPITLQAEKTKEYGEITYKVSGRIEGSLAMIGNDPNYVYAYDHGDYCGYAWRKGTLEYLQSRKDAGEQVEIVYEGQNFAGYGYITRILETSDDVSLYVPNALMTLYEAIELYPSGNTGDYVYEGLVIERNMVNDVIRMYIESENKDVLYYDLNNLILKKNEQGFFAFRSGKPYLEFVGGDWEKVRYDRKDRRIFVGEGTDIYHLDRDGNRDALVDPNTGMAYIKPENSENGESVFVWPIHIQKDEFGNVTARDKISTARIATVGEYQGKDEKSDETWTDDPGKESGYLTGSWNDQESSISHQAVTIYKNSDGQNLDGEAVISQDNGKLDKVMRPIYDEHGLVVAYELGDQTYEDGTVLYDRNGDIVRYFRTDHLDKYQAASYEDNRQSGTLHNPICHRYGESYVLQNTWISSDQTPNDPFHFELTDGQPDVLKRVPAGTYIMEELREPSGYLKGFPVGIQVGETGGIQTIRMEDKTIKAEFSKVDSVENYEHCVRDCIWGHIIAERMIPGLGEYGHGMVSGAELALFEAEKVYTSDTKNHPKGYYLRKKSNEPFCFPTTNSSQSQLEMQEMRWTSDEQPFYVEGIPQGEYLLEELHTPEGFVCSEPVEIIIANSSQVQCFAMFNDHTRVEVEKFAWGNRTKKKISGAEFALYPAIVDSRGEVCYDGGQPLFDVGEELNRWTSSDCEVYRDFIPAFEAMYRKYGTMEGTKVSWSSGGDDYQAEFICAEVSEETTKHPTAAVMMFRTDQGKDIRITIYEKQEKRLGMDFVYEYQFEYKKLPQINAYACAWMTVEGIYRMEYLPAGTAYVLRETSAPEGYLHAPDTVIQVADTADIQRYSIENVPVDSKEEPEPSKEPEESETPETPETPEQPEESEESESSEVPEQPEETKTSETPEESETSEIPETQVQPDGAENTESSENPEPSDERISSKLNFPECPPKIGFITASYTPEMSHNWRSKNDYGLRWIKYLPHLGDVSGIEYWIIIFTISTLGVCFFRKQRT